MNKYSQIVEDFYSGKIPLPENFAKIHRTHKRKVRTGIDHPKPTTQIIYERNWHYASEYGHVCPAFYGYSS